MHQLLSFISMKLIQFLFLVYLFFDLSSFLSPNTNINSDNLMSLNHFFTGNFPSNKLSSDSFIGWNISFPFVWITGDEFFSKHRKRWVKNAAAKHKRLLKFTHGIMGKAASVKTTTKIKTFLMNLFLFRRWCLVTVRIRNCWGFFFFFFLTPSAVFCFRHYPIGVLFDLHASNTVLPWSITVHFKVKSRPHL